MDPIISLQIVERELNKLRFASMDQNPHGIRDLLTSALAQLAQLTHERAAASAMLEALKEGLAWLESWPTMYRTEQLAKAIRKLKRAIAAAEAAGIKIETK